MEAIRPEEMQDIKNMFKEADENGDGFISKAELKKLMQNIGNWSNEEFDELFSAADSSGDGRLDYEEFLDWVMTGEDDEAIASCSPFTDADQFSKMLSLLAAGDADSLAKLSVTLDGALDNATEADLVTAFNTCDDGARHKLVTALSNVQQRQQQQQQQQTADGVVKPTSPIQGQAPGTSGLRKKTKVFMEYPYLHNYVQSVFNTLKDLDVPVEGGTLVVSGDGRYWNDVAIQIIIKMAFANGVSNVWCGTGGLLSTPATSAVIRCHGDGFVPFGGFICSASHNPGGPDDDFGIKYNCENGGPAPEKMTNKMVEWTAKITEFKICESMPDFDLSSPAVHSAGEGKTVEVFDCVEDHLALLKKCFDFEMIKRMIARPDFTLVYDCMCGVQGPYARAIIEKELGAAPGSATNADPRPDFGGHESAWHGHADPNLTYAVELVKTMGLDKCGNFIKTEKPPPTFGAAADGDADRNMILGSKFFASPSDSLAMLVANSDLIPQFKDGLKGCARSMPTSGALDLVAAKKGIECFETPTGWKFFGNLMDSGNPKYFPDTKQYTPFICGEESFGTGADHVREKDGMWAVLAWLQILAAKTEATGKLVTVQEVARAHWAEYGRNYYARYDYEGVDKPKAEEMMKMMSEMTLAGTEIQGMKVKINDVFTYSDPVDASVSKNQGIRIIFEDGSRVIFRLSGTGVAGATVRLYLEKYEPASGNLDQHQFDVVEPLAAIALEVSQLQEFTGRDEPSVIT